MTPPTAGETPLPPLSVTEESSALDRAIATRDLDAQLEEARKLIQSDRGSQNDAKTAETNALIVADKELRRDLDAQLQKLKSLKPSREHALAITKLQECVMWLGMSLKSLNDTRPYPSSYDPSNTKVEPTADGLKL